ncbi:MAG: prephenate dehydrogenase [Erysipelotrichaceae bacterium]|nr:prephenate dehydrogenase [Erysipelotrichaceae bacterium]MBQ4252149.1 prephenate dehydrogenase [Erysipelotrichaceae bacterium]
MISKASKITVVGLGLLGGSYAKGLYNAGYKVTGIDIDESAIEYGKKMHWIVDGGSDPALCQDSDIIISALYPATFISWVRENQHYFKPGSILTDVTGIKRQVIEEINSFLREDVEYIACHPMAGREYKGILRADCSQFENANIIIVPTEKNTERAIGVARDLARALKFKNVSVLSPQEHDNIIGFVSQLCHVIAISLMNISDNPRLVDYTGDSFRDLTRIANINEDLWPQLFIYNKDNLLAHVDDLIAQMQVLRGYIEEENIPEMKKLMIQATERRKRFGKR